jgi:hypothetical protein
MLTNHKEADEFFAQTSRAVLLPGMLTLVAAASVASVVFSLFAV